MAGRSSRRLSVLSLLLVSCAAAPSSPAAPPAASGTTFVVVRHAEKAKDHPRDPSLTPEGHARARVLAELLRAVPLVAAYATPYRRTQDTAAPAARQHGVRVQTYSEDEPAPTLVERLRRQHPTGTVLVVGHSPTVPEIVGALCRCQVPAIDERDYGNLYQVQVDAAGRPALRASRFP